MRQTFLVIAVLISICVSPIGHAADIVPNEVFLPGTQPNEVSNLESPDKCDNCHGGYDEAVYSNEPAFGWRGSAMGNAGRDPIFWATLAIAEQDFDGVGDLCIRCHSSAGWLAGRSTPTDGSGLAGSDDNGIDCDTCHKATNPDNLEHLGVMNPPFVANDGVEGFYGSGMLSLWSGSDKLGPYSDAEARHQFMQSRFHRGDICGSCHDVSNSVVGDLAPGNGRLPGADDLGHTGVLGGPVDNKAAFKFPPYMYGVVERTFSEWKSGGLDTLNVKDGFETSLPDDLKAVSGAINMAYQSAMLAGGSYEDGTPRTFTCQGCHMRPDIGEGCNKTPPTRSDLPKHDLTGGIYWVWPLIKYQDEQGTLRLGGGLTASQLAAMDAGQQRGQDQLRMAATLTVADGGNGSSINVTVTNMTGHKLITGYPEGRRMWLNVKWYDVNGDLVGENGEYGDLEVSPGVPLSVSYTASDGTTKSFTPRSIINLESPDTVIYEVKPAISKEWASVLISIPGMEAYYGAIPLGFDRITGAPTGTLSGLANGTASKAKTFHFALNDTIASDNRIPPYKMSHAEAKTRNALPVPEDQYGLPRAGGIYDHYDHKDVVNFSKPAGAESAEITLFYQGTSWEYTQFLWKANTLAEGSFLADEGVNFLDAWNEMGMVEPFAMATVVWGNQVCTPSEAHEISCADGLDNDCNGLIDAEDANCQCLASPEICDDGVDNNCNGLVDCADQECSANPSCVTMPCVDYTDKGSCNNDPDCEWVGSPKNGSCQDAAVCIVTEDPEISCGDGLDNDCNGLTDCEDISCNTEPVCLIDCAVYTTRNLCNAQAACAWNNKNKICQNI